MQLLIYKKFTNTFTSILMGVSGLCMILLYIYIFIKLEDSPFYITIARVKFIEEIDFERVQVNKLMYFLYRNTTEGATDADQGNQIIVEDLDSLCSGKE